MHGAHSNSGAGSAFLLNSIIDIEVAKTVASFLIDQVKYLHNDPFYHSCNM